MLNYRQKSFITLAPGTYAIKLFTAVICEYSYKPRAFLELAGKVCQGQTF